MITLARMGVESVIAHAIAHNVIADSAFDVKEYLKECRNLLEEACIPEYLIEDILDEAETQGLLEAAMPIGADVGGASSISPFYNARLLAAIFKLKESLEQVKA